MSVMNLHPAKMADRIEVLFGVGLLEPKEHCIKLGSDHPTVKESGRNVVPRKTATLPDHLPDGVTSMQPLQHYCRHSGTATCFVSLTIHDLCTFVAFLYFHICLSHNCSI